MCVKRALASPPPAHFRTAPQPHHAAHAPPAHIRSRVSQVFGPQYMAILDDGPQYMAILDDCEISTMGDDS